MSTRLVAYYRVSTDKQGRSGLGLEAQKACVENYATVNGATIIRSFTEVESGRKNKRPELAAALDLVRLTRSKLIIAKLDRLARNKRFLNMLQDSGLSFVACDMPNANEFTINIYASLAQEEARLISVRTREAMAVLKARGRKFGKPENLTVEGGRLGAINGGVATAAKARVFTDGLGPRCFSERAAGATLQAIADGLNAEGYRTPQGVLWGPVQVSRLLGRYERSLALI